ncbi:DUF2285 domain-containing protein [Mesorhizobium sp. LSHC440A00]|uniref:DUF2285 domain-containing protein n=1 Tax=Mesorhizobium sp. LSHC440A00 TaxID=1287307 RepID=UPI0032AECFD0
MRAFFGAPANVRMFCPLWPKRRRGRAGSTCLISPGTPVASQHILVEDSGRSLQLAASGVSILEPVRSTSSVLWSPEELKQRLNALECLNSLCWTGRLHSGCFPTEPRSSRLRRVLHALDGFIAGVSHREIGLALFGRARVEQDWADPGDHLRDSVRRAVRRGRSLMNGGYKGLLL